MQLAALAPHAQAQHQQAGAGGSAAAAVPKLLHLKEVDLSRSGQDSSLQLSIECFQVGSRGSYSALLRARQEALCPGFVQMPGLAAAALV